MAGRLAPCALALACACAPPAGGPPVISPEQGTPVDEGSRDLSRGGRERGVVEFALAGVTAATSVTLISLGAYQLHRGIEIRDYCESLPIDADKSVCITPNGDPYVNAVVSSTLSFFFAVPMTVASGFLVRRGLRIQRDYKRVRDARSARLHTTPWATPRGAGLGFTLRF